MLNRSKCRKLLYLNDDLLFDKSFLTFDPTGAIIISSLLSATDRIFLNVIESMNIHTIDERQVYVKWHRDHVFIV
ncbi:HNH endonuclease [Sporosarcina sp. PTS2304]|uniref:HNH endonuclease n=1 Tax=Sporosarcina sp. PTS2304 TaxID=2283194 RepID=UPI000E0DFD1C|nr:HNH endonuclease [Sporosarcina sp. PTS2304]AXH99750.1 HNH endonuclease [Sporosarcina sp. PTS2304]